jgi:broad specificity phosphatase PhoE
MGAGGMMGGVTLVYLVQHGEKEPLPGEPGLTRTGREQAIHTGRELRGLKISALYSSPMRTMRDRDWTPADGESSRQAGTRLQAFLADLADTPGPVAAVTHGGITVDLLRNLLGDDAVPAPVLAAGIPPCAVTAVDDTTVVMIASRPL